MVGSEQLKNLERVLVMNYETIQAPPQQPQTPAPQPSPIQPSNSQFNPYLLMQVLGNPNELRPKVQASSSPTPTPQPQPQMVAPIIQYPFVPFWTGCPLPFSPLAYPQMIIPQTMPAQTIGPQLLRPVNWEQVPTTTSYPSTPQQPPATPQPRLIQPARIPSTPQTIASPSLPSTEQQPTEYEQKVDKYRMKRAKRTWRKPDQRLSQIAQQRTRDANGKFSTEGKAPQDEQLTKQLADLKAQLSRTQIESSFLREKLLTTERELAILKSQDEEEGPKTPAVVDDMYQRQVSSANHQLGSAMGENNPWVNAEGGTIYSPFRGGNAMIGAFTDKVDLSQKKQALKPTNSPFLQAEFERQREDWVDLFLSEKDSSDDDEDMHIV